MAVIERHHFCKICYLTVPVLHTPALLAWADRLDALGQQRQPFFFLVDFEGRYPLVYRPEEWRRAGLRFCFPGQRDPRRRPTTGGKVGLHAHPISAQTYRRAFDVVQAGLRRGDSFLTNLTFATPVTLHGTLAEVYRQSAAKYRVYLPGRFSCFSPETFVTISATGYLETRPMKGTAADTPEARAALLGNAKEVAEHATIVDLLRNDLSQVARGVRVTDYRYVQAIERQRGGLLQTSSAIGGQLPNDWRSSIGKLLVRLLPAGSVSGAPKLATLGIIRRAELGPRGYYCGVAGYFDGSTLDTCVLIRFLEQGEGGVVFRSGGGITARSDWQEEYAELNAKIRIPLYLGPRPKI